MSNVAFVPKKENRTSPSDGGKDADQIRIICIKRNYLNKVYEYNHENTRANTLSHKHEKYL